jgi:hypothetical protein
MNKTIIRDIPKDDSNGCFRDAKTNEVLMCAFDIDKPCRPSCVACNTTSTRHTEHGSTSGSTTCGRGNFVIGHLRE